jgi:hypothetical protein
MWADERVRRIFLLDIYSTLLKYILCDLLGADLNKPDHVACLK